VATTGAFFPRAPRCGELRQGTDRGKVVSVSHHACQCRRRWNKPERHHRLLYERRDDHPTCGNMAVGNSACFTYLNCGESPGCSGSVGSRGERRAGDTRIFPGSFVFAIGRGGPMADGRRSEEGRTAISGSGRWMPTWTSISSYTTAGGLR